ncbi:MAG: threonine synthase [Candidatus Fermentibacteria bacterium]|nr:threonine synthase [Candidatus Fermentibacteria bacterium]
MENKKLLFRSTNGNSPAVSFEQALLKGLAPDGGLYMPDEIPRFTPEEILEFSDMEYHEIALTVGRKFLTGEIPDEDLKRIVMDAYDYQVPLEKVCDNQFVMRLDQGPTASFKDFAARMMGRLMQYFLNRNNGKLLILTATSGDTGSAIANAFYGLDNVEVLVLFPEKEVTSRQRKQMTTLGKNVSIVALDGKFDDCQALVKEAFGDSELDYLNLSSANSINIGRLIPQTMYYFYSFAKLRSGSLDDQVVFSVPSGNFGDLCGGLIAKNMGLPVKKFVVATNENDEYPRFVKSGFYEKLVPSRNCISSAMNVGHPSNIPRLVQLYGGNMDENGTISNAPDMGLVRKDMYAVSINDSETEAMISDAYKEHGLLLEPHGSVGWAGLQRYIKDEDVSKEQLCISLETAHPAKFPEKIREILSFDPELPPSLHELEEKEESYGHLPTGYQAFKEFLKKRYSK